jgi:2-polyprenyl-6-hydroxyphenyl methylase/3-demethylubiquinone-9 3-methyltransferase
MSAVRASLTRTVLQPSCRYIFTALVNGSPKPPWTIWTNPKGLRKFHFSGRRFQNDATSVDREEIKRFADQARHWWAPYGPAAMLQRMNPTRIQFITDMVSESGSCRFGGLSRESSATENTSQPALTSSTPLKGLRILDVGCGAGLLTESLAVLGAKLTAIDAAEEAIVIAQERQASMRQLVERGQCSPLGILQSSRASSIANSITYRCASVEELAREPNQTENYDIVTALEIVEHVQNPRLFLANLVRMLRNGGLLFISTLDRSLVSFLVSIGLAERVLGVLPRGTHDWRRFIQPEELCEALLTLPCVEDRSETSTVPSKCNVELLRICGMVLDPRSGGFRLSSWTDVNYICAARKRC